ncbi:DUF4177 domain-containing protein [Aquimarina gracilis]|uniref:DUF4177 domain-containing protein n=1 Tax=Aquimarina gracilis TaxID=874422 RepID=A0ABU6A0Z6_9FLAO|nr:DUF4177 domain-containing protein [Aquimarina gracilis]MEB3347789.1 DUF4177 domain-containing protein [Aquimarina gracilis]
MQKQYKVLKRSNMWSTEKLRKEVEDTLNKVSKEGWEIVSVAFGSSSSSGMSTAMITICK